MTVKNPSRKESRLSAKNWQTYEHAIKRIRYGLSKGLTYDQACNSLTDIDNDMKSFVTEDFLKILIAEEHFGSGIDIEDMALLLGLPYERLEACRTAMIEEVDQEIKTMYHSKNSDMTQ